MPAPPFFAVWFRGIPPSRHHVDEAVALGAFLLFLLEFGFRAALAPGGAGIVMPLVAAGVIDAGQPVEQAGEIVTDNIGRTIHDFFSPSRGDLNPIIGGERRN